MSALLYQATDGALLTTQRIDPIGWDGQDNTYWLFDGE